MGIDPGLAPAIQRETVERYGTRGGSNAYATNIIVEASLRTHDLVLSVPRAQMEGYEAFRLILLSSGDIDEAQTVGRIQQLCHLGGCDAAIILLLDQNGAQGGMQPFMKLHVQSVLLTRRRCIPC